MVLSNDGNGKDENYAAAEDISDQVSSFNPFDD